MSDLAFRCPKTANVIYAGVQTDRRSIVSAREQPMRVYCPYCKEHHELPVHQAVLEGPEF